MGPSFHSHLLDRFLFLKGKKLLLAVSGGVDSLVLCHLLYVEKLDFEMIHCNFKLRGEQSDLDEAFVKNISRQYHIPLYTKSFKTDEFAKTNKLSIQMAARELRYSWFKSIVEQYNFDFLLTAHHADDNLETFLINLSRESGLKGLTGIPEKEGKLIRPLLPFSKQEIEAYALQNKLVWRHDKSNCDTKYLRNKIRRQIIPLLKQLNPNFLHSFNNTLEHLKGSEKIVDDHLKMIRKEVIETNRENPVDIIKFNAKKLLQLADNSTYLYKLFFKYGFKHIKDLKSLLTSQSGKQLVSKTHRLVKHGDYLLLSKLPLTHFNVIHQIREGQKSLKLDHQKLLVDPAYLSEKRNTVAYFDKDLIEFPLTVRKWQKGDYFYPKGMKGKKKLSKFFKDKKFSLIEKENIWLLCSKQDIIWVVGIRMDQRYIITNKTSNTLTVAIES